MQSYYLSMHFQCWKVHVFKVFKPFCLPFALRLAQAGQQPAGHTPVCCDRCELNSILAMKGNERKEERRRERESIQVVRVAVLENAFNAQSESN